MGGTALPQSKFNQYFNDSRYIGEKKFDGSRYILQVAEDGIFLTSRRESVKGGMVDKTLNVPHIINEVGYFKEIIFDGEIDVRGDERNFKYVQGVMGSLPERAIQLQNEKGELIYKVFDLLELNGEDLRDKMLLARRKILEQLLSTVNFKYIELVKQFSDKEQLYRGELEKGQEGIMIKNLDSKYVEDKSPSQTWYKIKGHETYDGVVLGYEYGTPGSKYEGMLGTLKVYQMVNGALTHTSDVGGLTEAERITFKVRLDRGERLVIEFDAYGLFEETHKYRHPSFVRIRTDKNENECIYGKS